MRRRRAQFSMALLLALAFFCVPPSHAQANELERAFPQSKAQVEKALQEIQAATGGRLPVLDGFATSADHPLDRYRRGYYQSKIQVTAAPSGGSIVSISVLVTAWYADPVVARSGYQVLTSNGRLEADLLEQLADQLVGKTLQSGASSPVGTASGFPSVRTSQVGSSSGQSGPGAAEPTISAPVPRIPATGDGFSSSLAQSLAEQERAGPQAGEKKLTDKDPNGLQAEAESLEEVLRNQSHPRNLVAVKKSGTPVVSTASLTARTLFLASEHDEFEVLDFNRDWVHVRISGLSRGWIWRTNVEMPDGVPDSDVPTVRGPVPVAAELFHV